MHYISLEDSEINWLKQHIAETKTAMWGTVLLFGLVLFICQLSGLPFLTAFSEISPVLSFGLYMLVGCVVLYFSYRIPTLNKDLKEQRKIELIGVVNKVQKIKKRYASGRRTNYFGLKDCMIKGVYLSDQEANGITKGDVLTLYTLARSKNFMKIINHQIASFEEPCENCQTPIHSAADRCPSCGLIL